MDENFIPYEQIEPLLVDGMTIRELSRELAKHMKLGPDRYGLVFVRPGASFYESLQGGVRVVRRDTPEFREAPLIVLDEPVR